MTEVGRQPWIVYEIMKVEDAVTGNTGVWISFVRGRRAVPRGGRHHDPRPARDEQAVPQSRRLHRPRCALRTERAARGAIPDARGGGPVSTAVAVVLLAAVTRVCRVRRRRFRGRVLGPDRRRPGARRTPARGHRTLDRAGVGSQPRLVDLHLRHAVDVVPGGVRLDHADAVRAADDRGPGHRAARSELRLPQGGRHDAEPSPLRSRVRRSPRCWSRTAWERSPAGSPRDECRPAARRAIRWTAGSTRPRSSVASWPSSAAAYLSAVYLVWDARRLGQTDMAEYFRRRAVASAVVVGRDRGRRCSSCCAPMPTTCSTGSPRAPCRCVILSGACGVGARPAAGARHRPGRSGTRRRRGRRRHRLAGVWRSGPTSCPRA